MFTFPTEKIGKHFTLEEMLRTNHTELQQLNIDSLTPAIIASLKKLVANIIDPLREKIDSPIHVSSGYRCPALNIAVGSKSKHSQHLDGEAADLKGIKISNAALFHAIRNSKLPFDQLIWEYGTKQEPAWVHVSFGPRNRRQVLYLGI